MTSIDNSEVIVMDPIELRDIFYILCVLWQYEYLLYAVWKYKPSFEIAVKVLKKTCKLIVWTFYVL